MIVLQLLFKKIKTKSVNLIAYLGDYEEAVIVGEACVVICDVITRTGLIGWAADREGGLLVHVVRRHEVRDGENKRPWKNKTNKTKSFIEFFSIFEIVYLLTESLTQIRNAGRKTFQMQ